jgi:hypothetical protein
MYYWIWGNLSSVHGNFAVVFDTRKVRVQRLGPSFQSSRLGLIIRWREVRMGISKMGATRGMHFALVVVGFKVGIVQGGG